MSTNPLGLTIVHPNGHIEGGRTTLMETIHAAQLVSGNITRNGILFISKDQQNGFVEEEQARLLDTADFLDNLVDTDVSLREVEAILNPLTDNSDIFDKYSFVKKRLSERTERVRGTVTTIPVFIPKTRSDIETARLDRVSARRAARARGRGSR